MIRAALFDFGGVILSSPFEAFAHYERSRGLPDGFIRSVNVEAGPDGAWARLERGALTPDEFFAAFEAEAAAAGQSIDARDLVGLLRGDVRPAMVTAVRRCAASLRVGLLTNNFVPLAQVAPMGEAVDGLLATFDVIVESSVIGVRKPDRRFYEIACERLGIEPHEAVFLDDLGVNLKPAREMGMTTIKVTDPGEAITQLEGVVGFSLVSG